MVNSIHFKFVLKLYKFNKCRRDCNRQLMTEFKTNYKRYMHNVKGEFMRYQGNLKEYLGRNSPPGFYKCFKSSRQDRKCNFGI